MLKSKTFWSAVLGILGAWAAYLGGSITLEAAIGATLAGVALIGQRQATERVIEAVPKRVGSTLLALAAVILPASLGGCTTTPTDQMAGQQPVRTVASGWNSVATTEAGGQLRDTLGNASEGVEVPVINKDGTVVLDGQGNPVLVRIGRGLRDINFFFGEVKVEVQATSSGTASGTTQGATPTVTPTITPTVTIPTPGGP